MSHEIMLIQIAILAVLAAYCIFRGFRAFLRWEERRFAQQLEADFRAFVMVEEAEREAVRRRDAWRMNQCAWRVYDDEAREVARHA